MLDTSPAKIDQLANVLAEAMVPVGPDEQVLALGVYDRLTTGEPVSSSALAEELGRDEAEVAETLERWPGAFLDDDGRVISFWGLSIREKPHRFRVEGHQLYTWCAWDALFIPELIGRVAEVESRPPTGGETVRLVVDPKEIRHLAPEAAVVSILSPTAAFDQRVVMSFCHYVHFFPSLEDGERWTSKHDGTFLLSVADAHLIGRLVNGRRFGAALA
jgi:alkylmercury lyase